MSVIESIEFEKVCPTGNDQPRQAGLHLFYDLTAWPEASDQAG